MWRERAFVRNTDQFIEHSVFFGVCVCVCVCVHVCVCACMCVCACVCVLGEGWSNSPLNVA
jgi:hypothetical protein